MGINVYPCFVSSEGGSKTERYRVASSLPLTLFVKKAFQKYIFTVKVKTWQHLHGLEKKERTPRVG
mgnify:CR=1 FL=1